MLKSVWIPTNELNWLLKLASGVVIIRTAT